MKLNTKTPQAKVFTHEGGEAYAHMTPMQQLRRTVMACLLWEDTFYEDGKSVAARIKELSCQVFPSEDLAALAVECRHTHNLRHVSLLLLAALCQRASGSSLVSDTIFKVISRADELAEFVAVYAEVNGVTPGTVKKKLSAQAKKGLARAFGKFDEHQLAKYNRDGAVKLRDVLFLCHAKPSDAEREALYKRLVAGELAVPDTWEVNLSGGADKKETFERLIDEGKLGYLAVLRNLRNMVEAGVHAEHIERAFDTAKGKEKVLPFRYVAAARAVPSWEPLLDRELQGAVGRLPALPGRTVVLVDVSQSMGGKLSAKSDLNRLDAASALAAVVNAAQLRVFTFSQTLVEVAPRRGMACIDAVKHSQPHGGTYLAQSLEALHKIVDYDRIIVITDEQTHDGICAPKGKGYLINVATNKNGVGYGQWTHIDGFSENVLRYIHEIEKA